MTASGPRQTSRAIQFLTGSRLLPSVQSEQFCSDTLTQAAHQRLNDLWKRDELIENAGWATFPGSEPVQKVAAACANLLSQSK
jgi:hypothetical protein